MIYNDKQWRAFFDVIAQPEMFKDPKFSNQEIRSKHYPEAYAFVSLIFWVICFSMSRASARLETRLGVGTR